MTRRPTPVAPYAPLRNVLEVIRRLRDKRVPVPLAGEALVALGVPEGNTPRTHHALRFLGLVTDDGYPLPPAENLRRATSDEYPSVLATVVRDAYAPVFAIVDVDIDSDIQITDAFRQYEPAAQRSRMVSLFLGLCAEAGIRPRHRGQASLTASNDDRGRSSQRKHRGPALRNAARDEVTVSRGRGADDVVFVVTAEDLALLPDADFSTVWAALGLVARTRAQAPGMLTGRHADPAQLGPRADGVVD